MSKKTLFAETNIKGRIRKKKKTEGIKNQSDNCLT